MLITRALHVKVERIIGIMTRHHLPKQNMKALPYYVIVEIWTKSYKHGSFDVNLVLLTL